MAADAVEIGKAVFIQPGDDKADGVHMGGQHDPLAGAFFMADQIAHGVGGDLVHKGRGQLLQHLGHAGLLRAGGTGGRRQLPMKLQNIKHSAHLLP